MLPASRKYNNNCNNLIQIRVKARAHEKEGQDARKWPGRGEDLIQKTCINTFRSLLSIFVHATPPPPFPLVLIVSSVRIAACAVRYSSQHFTNELFSLYRYHMNNFQIKCDDFSSFSFLRSALVKICGLTVTRLFRDIIRLADWRLESIWKTFEKQLKTGVEKQPYFAHNSRLAAYTVFFHQGVVWYLSLVHAVATKKKSN